MPLDPTPKKFQFTLLIRGIITEILANAPKEWQKTTVTWKRSALYSGVVRAVTTPMEFILMGAGLLRQEFYQYGLLANVKIIIEKLNPSTWKYKQIYRGKTDFSMFEDSLKSVSITSTEDNLSAIIKANEGVEYGIDMDVPEAVTIPLPPLQLREKADFIINPSSDYRSDAFFILKVINNDQKATVASVKDAGFLADSAPNFATSDQWIFRPTVSTTVRVQGNVKGTVAVGISGSTRFQINVVFDSGAIKTLYDVTTSSLAFFDVDFDFTSQMTAGQRMFIYFKNVTNNNTNIGFNINGDGDFDKNFLTLNYNTISPTSTCKALPASYVYNEIIQRMNGKGTGGAYTPYPTQSYLLTTDLRQLYITCSNSIRKIENGTQYEPGDRLQYGSSYQVVNGVIRYNGIDYAIGQIFKAVQGTDTFSTTNDGSVLQVSFAEFLNYSFKSFFQSIYSIKGGDCSFGLENDVACLENLSYVYRQTQAINLGFNRTNVKIYSAIDMLYNSIAVGYNDPELDQLNASQAVNSKQTYAVQGLPINKELNLISDATDAEAYSIESIRVNPENTAASRSSNRNFFLWLKPDLTGVLQTNDITGVDAGSSYYNWFLSPKHNLLRGGKYLKSIFDKLNGYELVQTSALKNISMSVIENGIVTTESGGVMISNLPSPIFIPYYIDVTTDLQLDAMQLIDNTPFGYVAFNFNGITLTGFINEVSVDAAQNSQRDFKLLMTPNNNLLGLIR